MVEGEVGEGRVVEERGSYVKIVIGREKKLEREREWEKERKKS